MNLKCAGGTREDGASDVGGTLVPFRHLLLQRLVHQGAEAITPAQRPRLRIVQQHFVPGFEGLCRGDVEARLHTRVTETIFPELSLSWLVWFFRIF